MLYSWRQIAERAGISCQKSNGNGFETLDISVHYSEPDSIPNIEPRLIVLPCEENAWEALLSSPEHQLSWLPRSTLLPPGVSSNENNDALPVLFWGKGAESGRIPIFEILDNTTLICRVDVIATTYFMLTRWEETVETRRDEKGRFPSWASVAGRQGFLHRPIVDEWAKLLGIWLKELLPKSHFRTPQFRVLLSHDIDVPLIYTPLRSVIRETTKALVRKKSFPEALNAITAYVDWRRDPGYMGIQWLMNLSETFGFQSIFYLKTSHKGPFDSGYDLAVEPYAGILREIRSRNHQIGFHPGYDAFQNKETLATEKTKMDRILGTKEYGCRQHHLLFKVPDTWRNFEELGLKHDSTLTFEDQAGFRCGTCHPYPVFDVEYGKQLSIIEIPLIVMDKTIFSDTREHLSPLEGTQKILSLAKRCKSVGGVFTLLWHNSVFYGPDARWSHVYENVLSELSKLQNQTL